jgi:hypothetical protein
MDAEMKARELLAAEVAHTDFHVERDAALRAIQRGIEYGRALEQPASAGEGFVVVPRDALLEVLRISDRKHDAWGAVKAALATPTPPATAQEDGRAAKAIVQRALDGLTVPKLSPSKQEYFTAGVRHLAQAINAELRAAMLTSPDSGKEGV